MSKEKGMKMKKMMIMLGISALAAGVHAASVNWNVSSTYKTETFYVFNGNVSAAIVSAMSDSSVGGVAAFNSWLESQATESYKTGTVGSRGSNGNFLDTAADNLTFVILDDTLAAGNKYGIQVVSTAGKTYTTGTPPGNVVIDEESFSKVANVIAAKEEPEIPDPPSGDVPEPTSGLLMILGIAGLALRRKL